MYTYKHWLIHDNRAHLAQPLNIIYWLGNTEHERVVNIKKLIAL